MKNTKRIISLLLCALMLASLGVGAFADAPVYPDYTSIFVFGDSNGMGYGLPGYKGSPSGLYTEEEYALTGKPYPYEYSNRTYLHGLPGSFGYETAMALGLTNESQRDFMVNPALRARDALAFLGGDVDYKDEGWQRTTSLEDWDNLIGYDSQMEDGKYFINRISKQDGDKKLIVIYLGAAEIFHNALWQVAAMEEDENILTKVPDILMRDYLNFTVYYPMLIERIKELNDTADIVMVGTFNPAKDFLISEDLDWLPVFNAIDSISGLMNAQYKVWAKEYGAAYVDITNVETYASAETLTLSDLDFRLGHATPEGYAYIARQILSALETGKTATTDIVVDLGSVKSVSSVTIGGNRCRNYFYDPETHLLTVPYGSAAAKLLTVTETRENGKVYLATYQLSYRDGGYHAYRLFATRDIFELFTSILNSFKSVFSLALGGIPFGNK